MSLDPFCEFDKLRADIKRKKKKKSTILSFKAQIIIFYSLFLFSAGSEFVDQDSLDGQLPSSSRSLVHNDPSGITPSPTALAAPPPAPPPMNFAKGKFFRFQI